MNPLAWSIATKGRHSIFVIHLIHVGLGQFGFDEVKFRRMIKIIETIIKHIIYVDYKQWNLKTINTYRCIILYSKYYNCLNNLIYVSINITNKY